MRLLPRRARVSDEMTVWLSPHYRHSAFGVRGRYDAAEHTLPYVETGSAGCGFFVRDSQSHAYRHFVDEYKQRNKPTLLNLLLGKEFNINKHISHCQKALDAATQREKQVLLETYINSLYLARNAEYLERCADAIRKRMGVGHKKKYMVSALSHTKSRIGLLEHDIRSTQTNIAKDFDEQTLAAYSELVRIFTHVAVCHRIWHVVDEGEKPHYQMVYFDLGIFDFIQTPWDTPLMRDSLGREILFYPDKVIVARSAYDFDIIPIEQVTVTATAVDVGALSVRPPIHLSHHHSSSRHSEEEEEPSHHHTVYIGRIQIDPINTTFYLLDDFAAREFADAFNRLKVLSSKF